jgi:hypothetical protein
MRVGDPRAMFNIAHAAGNNVVTAAATFSALASYGGSSRLDVVVPVERIELPTFGLQNLLPVNKTSPENLQKAKFVDSIIGYYSSPK